MPDVENRTVLETREGEGEVLWHKKKPGVPNGRV